MQHFHSHQHKLSKTIHIPLIRLSMKYSQYPHLHHQWDKTRQDKIWHDMTWQDMTRWLTLSKNNNKNTSGNDKVRIKSPYFHQKSYFIWQNNTKVLIVQYMSNVCPIPNKHLCSLYHQWLVSRSEDEYDDQSSFKVKVYLPSLCSGCWGHTRYDDGFIFHHSEYITHNPYLRWLIRTHHSSHMTHHYSWLSQMTYHQ